MQLNVQSDVPACDQFFLPEGPLFISLKKAARLLDLTPEALRKRVCRGELDGVVTRIGRSLRFDRERLVSVMRAGAGKKSG
jgi:DNA-binding Lrp family transcriptional regulator